MYAYSQIEYELEMIDDMIEKEMHNTRIQALRKLSSLVAHSKPEIGNILAYAYFDSIGDAIKLADKLDLSKLDFLAIQEDLEAFKEEYLKDLELAQNF